MSGDKKEIEVFADGETLNFLQSEAQVYFRRLEDHFLAVRGSPLTLNRFDSDLAETWFAAGIPSDLVCRTIDEVFERRKESGKRKINSLRYLKTAVASAWKRHQEMTATVEGQSSDPEAALFDVSRQLESLAAALPAEVPDRERWIERIRTLEGSAEQIEEKLALFDSELLADCGKQLSGKQLQTVEERLRSALESLASRLPREELESAADRLREQILRDFLSLPILSLFAVVQSAEDLAEDS